MVYYKVVVNTAILSQPYLLLLFIFVTQENINVCYGQIVCKCFWQNCALYGL